jgi:hypothetical protein
MTLDNKEELLKHLMDRIVGTQKEKVSLFD